MVLAHLLQKNVAEVSAVQVSVAATTSTSAVAKQTPE